ncbi:putative cytoplasmic protein [Methylocaldum marinum]|uniref:Putative cytoplasmic protein n=1 Tax=Methylocaldum marinum TaxID=1432792 RepID=A0A250KYU3_9GAMM|nr:cupin domain-containing protein [Methylocaldum marinum]BBA36787.1 putative cytoplasmic protein [Methylocaldum marinum]
MKSQESISRLAIAVVSASILYAGHGWAGTTDTTGDVHGSNTSNTGVMIYKMGRIVDDSDFVDVTSQIPTLGGTVLKGNPTIKMRFDASPLPDDTTVHGIFEQIGQARIRIVFPFDEHMQVIHGVLKITDSAGTVSYLAPGDSYFIAQGSEVLWETLTPLFQKSFHDYTHH